MKNLLKNKKLVTALSILLVCGIALSSCKKETETDTEVNEADAVELTTNAIVSSTGGLSLQISSNVNVYKTVLLNCGVQKDSTITKTSAVGAVQAYNYNLKWSYLLSCNGTTPSQLTGNFTGSSTYDGLRMSSNDNSTGSFILTGLTAGSTSYSLNTNYSRSGTQTSKIGRNYNFTSSVNIKSTNIFVDKTTQQILSGTGSVAITGASTSGKSFSFNGNITFLGANKATLVLNSGTSYTISW